ncbi:LysM peptidoglycan-binding domain-containing protein [Macrococcoides caseolyticum]|uniref:LysM peptidoglycan-binding domain-containing protein n=1 Tax=Macrococcoides caseolyticum TaxID=69966 RepID=UPI0018E1585F|nr:LysM peptidoglycan-binding domain-containing protein [Macrococcus caseolyticus]QQB06127.1 LysM peptidoglycan-binding domain-containing protein [Macrococcus caseolyticus]
MANIQEIGTKFTMSVDGMLNKFKVLEQNFDNLPKVAEKSTKRMDKAFGAIDDSLKTFDNRLSETGKDFDTKKLQSELQKAQKEFKDTGNINKETMQSLQKEIKSVDWKSLDANSRDTFKTVIRNVNSVERNMNKLNDVKFLEGLPDDAKEAGKQLLALQKDVEKTSKSLEKTDDKVDFNKLNSELNKAKKELQSTGKVADNTLDQINKDIKDVDFESMSMSANVAFGKVEERAEQLDRKLRNVGDDANLSNSTKNISKDIDGATGSVGGLKGAFKGLGPVIGGALATVSITEFTKKIVESTAEIEALNSQYEQVMGKMKNTTDKYLGEMAQKYNVHPNELKKSMLQYQAILKSKGLNEQDAYETSKMWLERTVDGSAFANESIEESTGRMMAVIKGEYDSADTVMINLSQTMLNDKAQEKYGKKWEQLSVTQQEQLKVQESIRQHTSAGVLGQGVKEADSYEKNLAQLKNTWKDFLASYGGPALDIANKGLKGGVKIIGGMAKSFDYLGGKVEAIKGALSGLFTGDKDKGRDMMKKLGLNQSQMKLLEDSIANLNNYKDKVSRFISGYKLLFKDDGSDGRQILSKLGVSPSTIQKLDDFAAKFSEFKWTIKGFIDGFKLLFKDDGQEGRDILKSIGISPKTIKTLDDFALKIIEFREKFKNALQGIKDVMSGKTISSVTFLGQLGFDNNQIQFILSNIDKVKNGFKILASTVGKAIFEIGKFIGTELKSHFSFLINEAPSIFKAFGNIAKVVGSIVGASMIGIWKVMQFVWPAVKFLIISVWQNIQGVIKGGLQVIKGLIQVFSGLFTGDFRKMWEGIKNIFSGAIKLIWNGVQLLFYGKLLKGGLAFAKLFAGSFKSMWQGILNLFKNFGKFIWDTSSKVSKNVIGAFKNLWTGSMNIIKNLRSGLYNSWVSIKKTTVDAAVGLKDGVVGAFKNTWNGIKGWIKSIKDGVIGMKDDVVKSAVEMKNGLKDKVIGGLNLMIDGVNWVAKSLHMDPPLGKIDASKYSTGTGGHPEDGWATVGDKGPGNGKGTREIVQFPNGRTALFEKETTFWMPKGTHVYNNKQTEEILEPKRYSKGNVGDFAMGMLVKGMGNGIVASNKVVGAKKTKKALDYTAKKGSEVEKTTRAGVAIAEDLLEYIENPGKLVDLAMKKFGVDFSGIAGLPGDMMGKAYNLLKTQAVKVVTGWLDEASGANADGSEILNWPRTTPYSPNAAVPGYPTSFNGGRHFGIDLGIPSGTTIHAPTSGTVEQQSNYGGGIVARLLSGKIAQYFLHLSKVLKTGPVKQGDAIAKSGNSGQWTNGAHLHYQVESPASSELTNRNTIDPVQFLKGKGGGGAGILKGVSAPGNISNWISSAIKRTGVPDSWAPYLKTIAKYESGFNPAAVQHGYVDQNTGGNEARGLMQVTPQTYRGLMGTTEGMMNPINNITASIKWIKSRYGTVTNIPGMASGTWRGGYANGGIIPKDSIYRGGEEGKEVVIPTVPKRKKRANELIALADRMVNGKPKRYASGTKKPSTHKVKWGDTLWDISRKNGTTVKALQLLNGIKNHLIYPGQIIKLTGAITGLNKNVSQQSKTHKATVQALSKAQRMYNTGSAIAKRGKTSGKVTGKEDIAIGNLIMANMKNIGKLPVEKMQANLNAINKKINSVIASNEGKIATLNNKIVKSSKSAEIKGASREIQNRKNNIATLNSKIKKTSNKKVIAKYKKDIKAHQRKISSLENKIKRATNNKVANNARSDIAAYQAQINSLKKLKQSEVLKTNFLNSLVKQKQRLQNQLNKKNEERKALTESKMSFRDSIRDSYRGYAGFEAAKGNTSRDFIAFMKYRLNRMKKFAANVTKLRKMGLDPTILREILAGGIESAIPRVETLVGGGKKNVLEINKLQKQVINYVNNLSNEHSRFGYDNEIKAKDKEVASIKKQQTSLQSRATSYLTAKPKTKPKTKPKAPAKKTVASKVKAKLTPKAKPKKPRTHNIKWGDTLGGIAAKYHTSVSAIKKLNGLKSDMIYAGRKLKIPGYAKGGIVNIPQIAWIAEGGFAESIISHDPSQRVQQQKIWKDTGDKLGFTKDDALTLRMIQLLEEQREIQRAIAQRDTVLQMDGKAVGKQIAPHIDKELARIMELGKRGVRYGG